MDSFIATVLLYVAVGPVLALAGYWAVRGLDAWAARQSPRSTDARH